ncbi:hypothetical protein O181_024632 [Austropuccinia psidii MF-1]|uniref:Chromo domain-containing protein n=1 Tax=Austropuccinia psidii MF-1 TaxID=1389203 RepID=A0A9Q3GZ54_9BASI|nr:hypothetical protein [Austropuccinia psidii MF-1]
MLTTSSFHLNRNPSIQSSIFPCQFINNTKLASKPPPPVIIEKQEEWESFQVLDSNLKRGKLWYLVEWKGFSQDPERSTWEPIENLKNCPELVKDFHSLYPDKPGHNSSRA